MISQGPRPSVGTVWGWLSYARIVGIADAVSRVQCPWFCGWEGRYFRYRRHYRQVHGEEAA